MERGVRTVAVRRRAGVACDAIGTGAGVLMNSAARRREIGRYDSERVRYSVGRRNYRRLWLT